MSKAKLVTTVELDSSPFKRGLRETLDSARGFGSKSAKAFGTVGAASFSLISKIAAIGTAIGAIPFALLSNAALKAAADIELLEVALNSLTQSSELSSRILNQLQESALQTGVAMLDQAQSVRKFLAIGFDTDRALRLQKSILDIAGAVGLTSFQAGQLGFAISQVAAKGVVSMEELRQQIAEKGVPVFEALSQKTGLFGAALQKAVRDGKIPAETLIQVFENLEGPFAKFRGGAERLGATFTGSAKRAGQAWELLLRKIGQPIKEELTVALNTYFDLLLSLQDEAVKLGQFLAQAFKIGAEAVNEVYKAWLFVQEAIRQGKLGEIISLQFKIAGGEIINEIVSIGDFLRDTWSFAVEVVANYITSLFSKSFAGILSGFYKGFQTGLAGVGDIIRSTLSAPFNEIVTIFQAGLTFAIDNVLEGAGKVRLVFMEAMAFLEKQSAKLLISIASFINEYNVLFGIIGEKVGDKLLEKAGQALDRASQGRKEIEKLKQEGTFYEARSYKELHKHFSQLNDSAKLLESGQKQIAESGKAFANAYQDNAKLIDQAVQDAGDVPQFKENQLIDTTAWQKQLDESVDLVSYYVEKGAKEAGQKTSEGGDVVKRSFMDSGARITEAAQRVRDYIERMMGGVSLQQTQKDIANIKAQDPVFQANVQRAMKFFMEKLLPMGGEFVTSLQRQIDQSGWTQKVIAQIQDVMRRDPITGQPIPEKEATPIPEARHNWAKLAAEASGLMYSDLVDTRGGMAGDQYARQRYEEQRKANMLAKENKTQLQGINERLGSLGLIGA